MKHSYTERKPVSQDLPTDSPSNKILRDVVRHVESGQPAAALAALNRSNLNTDVLRNARGVCLLRLGKIEDALQLFRSLVLAPGSTWMKPNLPVIFRTNFCTALLLAGHPGGCREGLSEIEDKTHPSVIRLRQSLERWQKSLTGWSWLMWTLGAEPNIPVTLDFAPGDFEEAHSVPPATPPRGYSTEQAA